MATLQDKAGIPLAHAPDGAGYKLLELPPELLTLLESDDPPVSVRPPPVSLLTYTDQGPRLKIESSAISAVVKHDGQSWGLRQKNTSNALILLKPAPSLSSGTPGAELKAIATVHDTIELVPESSAEAKPAARGKWHEKFAKTR